jgi:hypothetical protein
MDAQKSAAVRRSANVLVVVLARIKRGVAALGHQRCGVTFPLAMYATASHGRQERRERSNVVLAAKFRGAIRRD